LDKKLLWKPVAWIAVCAAALAACTGITNPQVDNLEGDGLDAQVAGEFPGGHGLAGGLIRCGGACCSRAGL
jgi:hypothetical protein